MVDGKPGGKLWSPIVGLTEEEMEDWEKEGRILPFHTFYYQSAYMRMVDDQVRWFRAEAEMLRWLEEFELKHVEFTRAIANFKTMENAWQTLADGEIDGGRSAFSRRQANMYRVLHDDTKSTFMKVTLPRFSNPEGGDIMAALMVFRNDELSWIQQLASLREESQLVCSSF